MIFSTARSVHGVGGSSRESGDLASRERFLRFASQQGLLYPPPPPKKRTWAWEKLSSGCLLAKLDEALRLIGAHFHPSAVVWVAQRESASAEEQSIVIVP